MLLDGVLDGDTEFKMLVELVGADDGANDDGGLDVEQRRHDLGHLFLTDSILQYLCPLNRNQSHFFLTVRPDLRVT